MPTRLQILRALLSFGAAEASEKSRVLDEYQAHSDAVKAGPHVWSPTFEVIEALQSYVKFCADEPSFGDKGRRLLEDISATTDRMAGAPETEFADRSVFRSALGEQLCSLCRLAMTELRLPEDEVLPF